MKLNQFLTGLSNQERLFSLVLLTLFCTVVLFFALGNNVAAIISGSFISIVMWISSPIWRPEGYGKTMIRKLSLIIVATIALSQNYWSQVLINIIQKLDFPPSVSEILQNVPKSTPSVAVMVFVLIAIFIVNYLMRDNTVMKKAERNDIEGYSEKELRIELGNIKKRFKTDLDEINSNTSWSSQYYEPLKAQVEVKKQFKKSRKITDLLTAIKNDINSNVFLVIGDPGAGKSVALRKLAEDLLDEFESTGKLPLYINLKEWKKTNWTSQEVPTTEQLEKFVTEDVFKRLGVYEQDFLKKTVKGSNKTIFSHLLERGRFFIIFDSFDELPQVLDVNEASSLIDSLSSIIYKFLNAGNNNRGILSSRYYRMPSNKFRADAELFIRPFTDKQIFSTIKKGSAYSVDMVKDILNQRPDLSPVLRNPFTCSLLKLYSKKHPLKLPNSQTELYEHYLSTRIDECQEHIKESERHLTKEITKEKILDISKLIAKELFENYGLEAPTQTLISNLESKHNLDASLVRCAIDILEFANIGRIGKGFEKRFSFVHRRFTEYFIATTLLQEEQLPLDSIPHDSRWREALVLVAEVANDDVAKTIADYCWQQIKDNKPDRNQISSINHFNFIHPLRFLRTAFRGRTNSVKHFQKDLGGLVSRVIQGEHDILTKKCAIEATCILEEEKVNNILEYAFDLKNDWLSETAINSCRNYGNINKNLKNRLITYISELGHTEFMANSKDLIFNLSLSDAFKKIGHWCRFRQIDGFGYLLGRVVISLVDPLSSVLAYMGVLGIRAYFWFIGQLAESLFSAKTKKNFNKTIENNNKNKKISKNRFLIFVNNLYADQLSFSERKRNIRLRKTRSRNSLLLYRQSTITMISYRVIALFMLVMASENQSFLTEKIFEFQILPYSWGLSLFLFFLLMPWFNFILIVKDFIHNIKRSGWKLLFTFILMIPFVLIMFFLIFLIKKYEFIHQIFLIVGSIVFIALIGFMILQWFRLMKVHYTELKKFNNMKKEKVLTRNIIANEFMSLETRYFREKYVRYLDFLRVDPKGNWPDNKLPNINNDQSSMYLSQLEERWIGLAGA